MDAGFEVEAPLLAGHGTSLDDFERTGWPDWAEATDAAFSRLSRHGDRRVVVVGHSMGGALACRLAGIHPRSVRGIVAINPFVDPPAPSFRDLLVTVREQGHRSVPLQWNDSADPEAEHHGAYRELPVPPLLSLCVALEELRPRLRSITCPVLLLTSRVDNVVPTESSELLATAVSGPVERVWLERSHHLAPIDHDRHLVTSVTVSFASRVVVARSSAAP